MSSTVDHRGERSIFLDALDLPAAERPAFVERACSTNDGLRRRVFDLLAAHEAAGQYLAGSPREAVPADALLGTAIGPYTLVERLGEGGFGLVYLAEQREPLRRTVALKLLKPGVDTAQVVARFEAERQALAMMDHPNIAKVLDGGTTNLGRPYFVMEFVRGEPVTRFCDRHRLTAPQRVELLVEVCMAVQHAHQKGVIHRDIKPGNVLVALHDDRPMAKVIDFGIAKAMGPSLAGRPIHTEARQLVGTPAYMSPEQAGMSGMDIDTRADIYALGVLLYELLTGATPHDPDRLLRAGVGEIERIIREEDALPPSTRLTSLGPAAVAVAEARRTDVRRLQRSVRGDLDWIVMKAIEKDRSRRYDSAAALAEDLRRHLRGEPIEAGPPGAAYRVAKFVRRHRVPVVAGAAIATALACGLALAVVGLVRASVERDAADVARRDEGLAHEEASRQRHEAERMTERARVRSDFIAWGLDLGADAAALEGRREALTVREMLDVASATIDRAYAGAPHRQALARQQLGSLYHTLSLSEDARRELEAALALWREAPAGRDDEAMVTALRDLLYVHRDLTAPETVLDPLRRERAALDLAILERRCLPAQKEPIRRLRAAVDLLLEPAWPGATALQSLKEEVRGALDAAALSCGSEELVLAVDALAIALVSAANRWWDASLVAELARLMEWVNERCPDMARADRTIAVLQLVAADLAVANRLDEQALRLCRAAQASLPRHLPPGHWIPEELRSLEGHVLGRLGRTDEATALLVDGCQGLIDASRGSPPHVRGGLVRLLLLTAATGRTGFLDRFDTPLRPLAASIERLAAAIGAGPRSEIAASATSLAEALRAAPRGADDPRPQALTVLIDLLEPYADSVSGDASKPCSELLAALTDIGAGQAPDVRAAQATALWWQAVLLLTQSNPDAARACIDKALELRAADLGPDHLWTNNCRRMLGRVMLANHESIAAARVLVQAYEDMRRVATPTNVGVIAAARDAALGLGAVGRERDAGDLLAEQVRSMLATEDAVADGSRSVPAGYHLLVARPLAMIAGLPVSHYQLAEDAARRAMAGLPDSGLAPLTVAAALHRQGRHAEVEALLLAADEIDGRQKRRLNPLVALFHGACCMAQRRATEAATWFAEADRRAEDFSFDSYTTRSWDSLRQELRDEG